MMRIAMLAVMGMLLPTALAGGTVIDSPPLKQVHTIWLGFGYSQYPQDRNPAGKDQPWTATHWRITTQRMGAIKPSLVRINAYRDWFNANANGKPLPVGTYHFNSWRMRSFRKVLRWYQDHGVPVRTGLWGASHAGQKENRTFDTSADFARLQCDFLTNLIVDHHLTCIRWYTPVNEPGGSGIKQADWSVMMHKLHVEMAHRNLPENMLVGADMWDGWTPYAAQHDRDVLSAYESHKYLNNPESWLADGGMESYLKKWLEQVNAADPANKPVYLGEEAATDPGTIDYWFKHTAPGFYTPPEPAFAIASLDLGIQTALSGESGALAWALDGFDRGKDPGMWNIDGANGGITLRPWYYTWSLLCRAAPAKSLIYAVPGERAIVAKSPAGIWAIVAVNRKPAARTFEVRLPDDSQQIFERYTYDLQTSIDGKSLSLPATPLTIRTHAVTLRLAPDQGVVLIGKR